MKGIGVREARGFWAEAWSHVLSRRVAVCALAWLCIVAFFAVFSPVLASGHPLWMRWSVNGVERSASPLWSNLRPVDLILLAWTIGGGVLILLSPRAHRAGRAGVVLGGLLVTVIILAVAGIVQGRLAAWAIDASRQAISGSDASPGFVTTLARQWWGGYVTGGAIAALVAAAFCFAPVGRSSTRVAVCLAAALIATLAIGSRWLPPMERFDYPQREAQSQITATYTVIPWSPGQRFSDLVRREPLTVFGKAAGLPVESPGFDRRFILGTDAFGADVLSQILHACRLSISIGLVSTGIALTIGIIMGALMGYFGGWIDLVLYRVVEIFMAVPVLFLLIVAVAVLPDELKTTYVIMAIIGCFTWTGMARFTRAEFLKLRNQDFVQAAEATGVPLRSILFRHILPNGVAPVLVDASFAIAAAIAFEATLSYLGLGPVDSPSWGKLLASAISQEGEFKWWLAVFPGAAIFLTVLSYNLLGEALRDAIDPKLKKARV